MVYICIFKTGWLINKLSLDTGYDEERFEFNIPHRIIFKIIIIIIGWLLLANVVPALIKECVVYFQKVSKYEEFTHQHISSISYIIIDLIKIIAGVLMVTCGNTIANFIERKRRGPYIDTSEK